MYVEMLQRLFREDADDVRHDAVDVFHGAAGVAHAVAVGLRWRMECQLNYYGRWILRLGAREPTPAHPVTDSTCSRIRSGGSPGGLVVCRSGVCGDNVGI